MESSIEGTEDSSTENDSENVKMLLETKADVSSDIQIVENLELFVLLEDDPNKELNMKSGNDTDIKPDSHLQVKEKSLVSKAVEKKFQCEICQKLFKKIMN